MNIKEAVRIALQSLWANKLRSVLTLLGVVIGVSSVIAVVTFVSGINGYVAEKIFRLGADVFKVSKMPSVITSAEVFLESQKRKNFTMDDYQAVLENCKSCLVVAASAPASGNSSIKYGTESSTDSAVRGWTPSMATIYDLDLIAGRSLTEADQNSANEVAVIGYDIYDKVLGGIDPINREIRADGHIYRVIGVGKTEGSTLGQSRDNWIAIPMSAWLKQYGAANNSINLYAKATGVGPELATAMDEVRVIMRSRRHDAPGKPDSFQTDNSASSLSIWASISSRFFAVTIAIASISLVVGGIVIMNIMLLSVTERTREIGVRKALGARRGDILLQFLIEAGPIAVIGGAIGVLCGIVVAKLVYLTTSLPAAVQLWSVLGGLLVALSVGLFFGTYPASKASRLDPVEALRAE